MPWNTHTIKGTFGRQPNQELYFTICQKSNLLDVRSTCREHKSRRKKMLVERGKVTGLVNGTLGK